MNHSHIHLQGFCATHPSDDILGIMGMEHKSGLIKVMDDKCNSADLAIALNGNTKIIATTIQKFPYLTDSRSYMLYNSEAHQG